MRGPDLSATFRPVATKCPLAQERRCGWLWRWDVPTPQVVAIREGMERGTVVTAHRREADGGVTLLAKLPAPRIRTTP